MIASIIPAKRLPRNMGAFDYEITEELTGEIKVGSVVRVNFGGQGALGLVAALKKETERQKPLKKIEKFEAQTDKKYVDFLKWLAEYYLAPEPLVAKTALPELPKRSGKISPVSAGSGRPVAPPKIIDELKNLKLQNSLLIYDDWRIKIAAMEKIIGLTGKKQVLILSPNIDSIFNIHAALKNIFGDEIALLYNKLPKTAFAEEWRRVLAGGARIIIGTRQGIFAPALDLGAIILDDEESSDFKQYDQNPRYDARTAAEYLSRSRGAALIIFSEFARPAAYYKYSQNIVSLVSPPSPATIRDLGGELKISQSILGEEIIRQTSASLQNGQKVVLFLNRRGLGEALYCRDCGFVPRCEECGLQLKIHESYLRCHHCDKSAPLPLVCAKCGGSDMKALGFGTKQIERDLRKRFPDYKIGRLDKDAKDLPTNFDILIATELIFKRLVPRLQNEKIGFIGALKMEPGKNPGPEGTFETLNLLTRLKNLARRFDAEFIIQTSDPENIIFGFVNEPEKFYTDELSHRKTYGYPPFTHLIRIFFQHKDAETAEKAGIKIFKNLEDKLAPIEVFTVKNIKNKIRGRYRFNIIIKAAPNELASAREKLKILVPADWHIDVDPVNLND